MTGTEVRAIRKSLGLTQKAAAAQLGCAPQTILRAEQRGCDGIMAFALAHLAPGTRIGRQQRYRMKLAGTLLQVLSMVEGRDTPIALAIRDVVEEGLK